MRASVERAETSLGRRWDGNSERLTASLTLLARQNGFGPDDTLEAGFNRATPTRQPGQTVFLNRTGGNASPDPYANRAQMETAQALAQSPEATYRHLDTYNQTQLQAQEQARTLAPQIPPQNPGGPDTPQPPSMKH